MRLNQGRKGNVVPPGRLELPGTGASREGSRYASPGSIPCAMAACSNTPYVGVGDKGAVEDWPAAAAGPVDTDGSGGTSGFVQVTSPV